MKRKLITILSLILVVALGLGIFASCKKGLTTEQLDKLYKEFTRQHREDDKETPISYWVDGDVHYIDDSGKTVSADVKWTIEGTTLVTVGTEPNVMGKYQIIVPEEVNETINYKLVGTLVDAKGKSYGDAYRLEMEKTISAGNGKGTQESPYSVTNALAQCATIAVGGWSADKFYVKGIVVTAPSYNSSYQSYTFWIADSKDSTNKLQIYSGRAASGITKIYQNDTVVVNGYYLNYSATNPEMTGSTKENEKHDYPEIISCTTGTSAISVLPNENADVVLSKTSGVNGTTFTFTVAAKNDAEISSVKVNNVEVTAANGTYTGTIEGDTTVSVVALVAVSGEQTVTVDLAEGFETYASEWSTSYSEKTLDSAILNINTLNLTLVLSNANKSTATITDIPVMATKSNNRQYATLTVNGCQINEITFKLREWGSAKTFNTLCIEYTTDGTNWTVVQGVGLINADPEQRVVTTLTAEYLPSSVIGVRLAVASSYSSNVQLGIEGFTVKTGPVTVDNSEARIGSAKYDTLAEAVAEAQDNDTIMLMKDVVIAAELKITKKITLNLNGKTISNTEDIYGNDGCSLIAVMANGELTITGNGKLDAKENDCYALSVFNGGKLTVENGEFVGNKHSVYAYEGNVVINGGTYSIKQLSSGEGMDRYRFLLNLYDANGAAGTATITVYGGSFVNYDPAHSKSESPEVSFLAEGYETTSKTENGATVYTVRLAPPTTEHAGTAADPYSVADAKKWADYLNGAASAKPVYVTGTVKGEIKQSTNASSLDCYYFSIVTNPDGENEQVCIMYYVKTIAAPQEGDVVVVKGSLKIYNGDPEILQNGGLVVSVNGVATGLDGGNTPTTENDGTEAHPYTVAEAIAIAKALEGAASSQTVYNDKPVYVKGYVVSISAQNIFYIADTIGGTSKFQFYKGELDTGVTGTIYINDEVVIYGYIANFSAGYVCELAEHNDVKPLVKSLTTGNGSIAQATSEDYTITFSKESGTNGDKVTFTIAVNAQGKEVQTVTVTNGTATYSEANSNYEVTLNGNMVVTVELKVAGSKEEKIILDLSKTTSGIDSTASTTEVKTVTINGVECEYLNCKQNSGYIMVYGNATAAQCGYITGSVNGTIKSIKFTTGSSASDAANYIVIFSATELEGAQTGTETNVKKGQTEEFTCEVNDASYFYIGVSTKGTDNKVRNGQIVSIEIVYEPAD